jgi:co-chaperonin GroES (HSP10)
MKVCGRDDLNFVQPYGEYIFVERLDADEKKTAHGIILSKTNGSERYFKARVLAVGHGKYQAGIHIPLRFEVGDIVLHRKNHFDGECDAGDRYIVAEGDVQGKVIE